MSEYINRNDALNCFHDWVDKHGDVVCADDTAEYIEIASLPSIEVVRCKDCKRFDPDTGLIGLGICEIYEGVTAEYGFCHHGERKDGEADE